MKNNTTTREILEQNMARVKHRFRVLDDILMPPSQMGTTRTPSENLSEEVVDKAHVDNDNTTQTLISSDSSDCINENELAENTMFCIKIPSRFSPEFAQKFLCLDKEWQDYLCALDDEFCQENQTLRQELAQKSWLDSLHKLKCFNKLSDDTESPREWVEKMAFIEYMLETNPREAFQMLEQIYANPTPHEKWERFMQSLSAPETMADYFVRRRREMAKSWFDSVLTTKDSMGMLKFPHHAVVKDMIIQMLQTGQASGIDEAYEMAIWCHPCVREKLIQEKLADLIREKALEAGKAKAVSFVPNGKGESQLMPAKGRSTRELLEEAMIKCRSALN